MIPAYGADLYGRENTTRVYGKFMTAWATAAGEFEITFPSVWSRSSPMSSPLELVFTEGEKLPAPEGETNYHDGMGREAGVLRGADYKNIWEKYGCN